jgi:class 3 adenylate cyclase
MWVATDTLLRNDAVIDKLIGDEVMAFFVRASADRSTGDRLWKRHRAVERRRLRDA